MRYAILECLRRGISPDEVVEMEYERRLQELGILEARGFKEE
jgi:hypothetical protein